MEMTLNQILFALEWNKTPDPQNKHTITNEKGYIVGKFTAGELWTYLKVQGIINADGNLPGGK